MHALRGLLAALAIVAASPTRAHGVADTGAPPGWTWDPAITVPLLLVLVLFVAGWTRLHARSDRGAPGLRQRAGWFVAGWLVMALALVSPLHEGGERSFTLHMIEHELLMLAAAPMLVAGRPLPVIVWALPAALRRSLGQPGVTSMLGPLRRLLASPVAATLCQAAVLWLWHAPVLFDLALASSSWHAAQHLAFVFAALWFWAAVLPRSATAESSARRAVAGLCLFATSIVTGALGALMAVSSSPWYAGYARIGMAPMGLTPAEDQQVAGLVMWVPGGLVHAIAALVIVRGLLRAPPREMSHAL